MVSSRQTGLEILCRTRVYSMTDKKVNSAKPKNKTKTVSKGKGSETEIQRFKWDTDMVGNLLQVIV